MGEEPTPSAMTELISQLTEVATAVLTQVGEVCTTIVEQPLLLFCTGILFLGGAIGIVGRLLSRS